MILHCISFYHIELLDLSFGKGRYTIVQKDIKIKDEYITLGQLLKLTNHISTGGEVKFYLQEQFVTVNGEREQRRGRKCYDGDQITINNTHTYKVVSGI